LSLHIHSFCFLAELFTPKYFEYIFSKKRNMLLYNSKATNTPKKFLTFMQ
jgi:hypothetical protein